MLGCTLSLYSLRYTRKTITLQVSTSILSRCSIYNVFSSASYSPEIICIASQDLEPVDVAEIGAGLLDTVRHGLLTLADPDTGVVELRMA
jgi:hypothetical protein